MICIKIIARGYLYISTHTYINIYPTVTCQSEYLFNSISYPYRRLGGNIFATVVYALENTNYDHYYNMSAVAICCLLFLHGDSIMSVLIRWTLLNWPASCLVTRTAIILLYILSFTPTRPSLIRIVCHLPFFHRGTVRLL